MRNWKHWTLVAVLLLVGGAFYVNAQDMIILKDGDVIEAKVVEISQMEIRYKRLDNMDGPMFVIPTAKVRSIRYENGTHELNLGIMYGRESQQSQPDKFIFGINANAGGALGYLWEGPSGFGINIELGKGKFNSEINLMFPTGGFGALFAFNGFWPSKIGGFYLGGGIGFSFYETYGYTGDDSYYDPYYGPYDPYTGTYQGGYRHIAQYGYYTAFSLPVGLNIGYKFVTKPGLYFRIGAFAGYDFLWLTSFDALPVYIKPDLAIGWTMK